MTPPMTTREKTADHAELARLAEAATSGPWVSRTHGLPEFNNVEHFVVSSSPGINEGDALVCTTNLLVDTDAAFIAAANPATVLDLLSEIAALRVRAEHADALASKHFVALREKQDDAAFLKHGKLEAERQRDEAVGLLRELADGRSQKNNINEYDDLSVRASTLIATQGADQCPE